MNAFSMDEENLENRGRVVRMAIVDPNDATRSSLKSMLLGIDAVWLEAECSRNYPCY